MGNFVFDLIGKNIVAALVICIIPLVFILPYALIAILGELKIGAWMQDRVGPMRTGWKGVLQPVAEVVKLLQKEDITPTIANKPLFNLAPFIVFIGAFAAFAVLPFSEKFIPSGINLGLFFVFAVGSFAVIGIVMGGWASNNKYSLLGAMRSVAQIISYELPAGMVFLSIATIAGTLDMQTIILNQSGPIWNWYIFGGPQGGAIKFLFIPFFVILFIVYLISSLAETNRTPFDIPEGESEIVAGYHTEYSGMKFAMFFMAEYANMYVVSAIIVILFLGGWSSPFGTSFMDGPIWGIFWMVGKAFFFVFVQIWLRWTLPRLRVDQLMYLGWKVLLPLSIACFMAIAFLAMIN
ncbi:MAG: NADH-quinone oxidoreductase subunit NuoH [Candidatus Kapabacteria bacterium]|nr:NADH-quinone oxidoreductase subunit NuoH [Candidatus Kapabacteria bacterium]